MLRWQATLTRVPKQEKKNSIRYSDDRWGERMKKKFKAKRTGLRSQRGLQNEGSSWEGGHQEIFMGCLRLRHTTGCRRESTNTLYPTPKYSLYKNAMTEGGLENPPPKSWPTNRIYRKFLLSDFFHPYITVSNFFSLFSPFDATKVNAKYSASAKLVKRRLCNPQSSASGDLLLCTFSSLCAFCPPSATSRRFPSIGPIHVCLWPSSDPTSPTDAQA